VQLCCNNPDINNYLLYCSVVEGKQGKTRL